MTKELISLEAELAARLSRLADRSGLSKTDFVQDAVLEKLEEYEDYFRAQDSLAEFRQSNKLAINLEDLPSAN